MWCGSEQKVAASRKWALERHWDREECGGLSAEVSVTCTGVGSLCGGSGNPLNGAEQGCKTIQSIRFTEAENSTGVARG